MNYDVITIGAATRDVFLRSRAIKIIRDDAFSTGEAECFALGSKIEVDDILFETGGGGTNTAVSFARQHLKTGFIGKIGAHDARGREVLLALKKEHVDTTSVVYDRVRETGYSVLLLTSRGERTVLVYRGASADIDPKNIRLANHHPKWLYISSLGGRLDTIRRIWKYAAEESIHIAWNPGAAELAHGYGRLLPFIKQTAVFSLNQEEAATLLGYTRHQDRSAFETLRRQVSGITLITEGAEGALAGSATQAWHSATRQIRVVDTTGAGDAFGSGFVGAYIRTKNVPQALQYATANSESVIQHVGAKPGLLAGRRPAHPVAVTRV